jgi:antitoxin HigA-1
MPSRSSSRSSITTKGEWEDGELMPPLHPGETLREDFMKPLGLSANALALALRVPVTRISEIVRERRGITADTALRLARYFNMTPEFWMRLQMDYDLESASGALDRTLREEIRPRPVNADRNDPDARAIA